MYLILYVKHYASYLEFQGATRPSFYPPPPLLFSKYNANPQCEWFPL